MLTKNGYAEVARITIAKASHCGVGRLTRSGRDTIGYAIQLTNQKGVMSVRGAKVLRWCSHCKEKSVTRIVRQDGKRVEYCINKGCGYYQELPNLRSVQ